MVVSDDGIRVTLFVVELHEQTLFAKRMSIWTYLSLLKKREPSVSTVPLFSWNGGADSAYFCLCS